MQKLPIKFRAWDVNDEEILSWEYLITARYNQDYYRMNKGQEKKVTNYKPGSRMYTYLEEGKVSLSVLTDCGLILERWTGLYDVDGKEIYEGDIVEAWVDLGPAGEDKRTYTVEIGIYGCNLEQWTFKENYPKYMPKIVGNIHEKTK